MTTGGGGNWTEPSYTFVQVDREMEAIPEMCRKRPEMWMLRRSAADPTSPKSKQAINHVIMCSRTIDKEQMRGEQDEGTC